MEPGTGLVRVMVGGKSFSSSQFNRATQALRSPGSTFKLFPYAAAIDAGVKPEDIFMDAPRCWSGYCPKNFRNKYYGKISLAEALKKSLNTVAVQLQDKVGFDAVITTANRLGIGNQRPLGRYYPLAIGAYEQTVLDMTTAYAAVANRGVYVKPMAFEEIRGPEGNVLWSRRVDGDKGRRAMDSDVADAMNWMLQRVVTGGTGAAARLDDRPVAGKTGTSEGARDLWFIGSIPQLTTAVWFGYDNNAETKSNSGKQPGLEAIHESSEGQLRRSELSAQTGAHAHLQGPAPSGEPTHGRCTAERRSDRHRSRCVQQRRETARSHNSAPALCGSS